MMKKIIEFFEDETAMGTVEMVLLVIILVGLAVLFKNAIKSFFDQIVQGLNGSETLKDIQF